MTHDPLLEWTIAESAATSTGSGPAEIFKLALKTGGGPGDTKGTGRTVMQEARTTPSCGVSVGCSFGPALRS